MRTHLLAGIVLVCAAASSVGAQTETTPSSPPQPTQTGKGITPIILRGCLQGGDAGTDVFTLVDAKGGTIYRLSGADVRPHVGRRVQIVGGLVPSANVAAQAGAIAAVSGPGPGAGRVQPGFRVTRVRPLAGACAQR